MSASDIDSFAPIVSEHAKVLILGSMPGIASLQRKQYYAHPRNTFWPIMNILVGSSPELCYEQRKERLMASKLAVWDVLQSCSRIGSSDAKIEMASIRINNFADFFTRYKDIGWVFFNGAMAEKIYKKHIFPTLNHHFDYLLYKRLPSTSPAHASLTLEQKIAAWKVISQYMVE